MGISSVIIGAPFGNYLNFKGCTPTLGTFTVDRRGGLLYRAWRCLKTLRPLWGGQGWINQLGLPNPGLKSLFVNERGGNKERDKIISIRGFCSSDWQWLVETAAMKQPIGIELNLSCPNVGHQVNRSELKFLEEMGKQIAEQYGPAPALIAKLPPVRWMEHADFLYDMGIRWFHCCNTIPTAKGGISGSALKPYSLWAVEEIKSKYSDATVVGGGGIYHANDALDYWNAGADHVAIASALLNPFRWRLPRKVLKESKRRRYLNLTEQKRAFEEASVRRWITFR